MQFYTNRTIIQNFKNYIQHLMTHRNPYTDLTYAEDPTIFAHEAGNELGGPKFDDEDVPVEWTQEACCRWHIRREQDPSQYPEVDVYSDHFYPLNVAKLEADIELVGSAKKVYLAGDMTGLD